MQFIPVPNCASVVMAFTYHDQQCMNKYHLESESPFDQASLALAGNLFSGWWSTNFRGYVGASLILNRILLRALDTDHSPAVEYTQGLPLAGQGGSPNGPGNVTVAVKWASGLAGRSYRGRTFHLGLPVTQYSGNSLVAGVETTLAGKYNQLITDLDATPWHLVVVSYYTNGAPRTQGVVTEISEASVDVHLDSQRRRLAGRGL